MSDADESAPERRRVSSFLDEACCTKISGCAASASRRPSRRRSAVPSAQHVARCRARRPTSLAARQAPTASKFSEREADRIHQLVARGAGRARRGAVRAARASCGAHPGIVLGQRRHVGRRRRRRRAEDVVENPLAAQHRRRRRGVRRGQQDGALAEQAAPRVVDADAAEARCRSRRRCRSASRSRSLTKRVVGGHQIEARCDPRARRSPKNSSASVRIACAAGCRRSRERDPSWAGCRAGCAGSSHCPAKFSVSARAFWVGEHAPHLAGHGAPAAAARRHRPRAAARRRESSSRERTTSREASS